MFARFRQTRPFPVPRRVARAVAVLLLALSAAVCWGAGVAAAAQPSDPEAFVRDLARTAITTVADRTISPAERADRFRTLFLASFDLPEIGRFVLGRHWRTATEPQRQEFQDLFADFTVLTWTRRFKDYHGETLDVRGALPDNDGGWLVDSRILRDQAQPLTVRWRVHPAKDSGWRITDIVVENASMAVTLRSDFAGAMQANGGHMEALLASMRDKNAQLGKDQK
jgi:phospholipid transport system substrate-binding protein